MKRQPGLRDRLRCPECNTCCVPAHDRGRRDRDGNWISHGLACRCRWCDWWWWDDEEPVKCSGCGALVAVECDDGVAFAVVRERAR